MYFNIGFDVLLFKPSEDTVFDITKQVHLIVIKMIFNLSCYMK